MGLWIHVVLEVAMSRKSVHIEIPEPWGDDPQGEHERFHDAIEAIEEGLTPAQFRLRHGEADAE